MSPLVSLLIYLSATQIAVVAVVTGIAMFCLPKGTSQKEKDGTPLPSH